MSEITDLDEGSIVEYSLAELGFVLVFVLLLLSGWEINSNAANLEEEEKSRTELLSQLEVEKKQNQTLIKMIPHLPPEATEFPDDFMFIDKREYLTLKAKADVAKQVIGSIAPKLKDLDPSILEAIITMASSTQTPLDDPLLVSEAEQEKLKTALDKAKEDVARLKEELAENPVPLTTPDGGKVGTVGFCTYEPPTAGSKKVYGSSVALGTVLVEEDGVTLVDKNSAIKDGNFVDIAGENYDTTLVYEALSKWPLGQKLSPKEFSYRGAKFIDIGNLPSDKRVACRFGMNHHTQIYSEKTADMLEKIVEGSFLRNSNISAAKFLRQFPKYDSIFQEKVKSQPVDQPSGERALEKINKGTSSQVNNLEQEPQKLQKKSVLRTPTKVLSRTNPVYPRNAKRRNTAGVVELSYKVTTYGRATGITIVRESPNGLGFGKASNTALKQYFFQPATENGVPILSEEKRLVLRFK